MYNAWSIFIGVSVPEMPRSWKLRIFFPIYVCYCFAISTVFQAFFVSYLVEMGYGERITTFRELLDSSVNCRFNAGFEVGMSAMEFSDHLKFPLTRRVDCANMKICLMRMISDGKIATISNSLYVNYILNELGYQEEMNSLCSLEDNFLNTYDVSVFFRGSPFLDQYYKLAGRCMEGDLAKIYRGKMVHEVLLKGRVKSAEDGSNMYFVFTLSHMVPAFSVLCFGYLCSTIVLIAESLHKRFSK